jgi:hypothetical protein
MKSVRSIKPSPSFRDKSLDSIESVGCELSEKQQEQIAGGGDKYNEDYAVASTYKKRKTRKSA